VEAEISLEACGIQICEMGGRGATPGTDTGGLIDGSIFGVGEGNRLLSGNASLGVGLRKIYHAI
jgi:hypothetical protein